jgi:hypothetical protein
MKLALLTTIVIGDICVFMLFIVFGKSEHGVTLWQSFIRTLLPFAIAWFSISPWLGSYRTSTLYSFRKIAFKIPFTWILCGVFAVIARVLITDSSFLITFAIVAILFQGLFLIMWRCIFMLITLRYRGHLTLNTDKLSEI